ncbi:glycoside hydrolase family 61 protein [Infundibulicybe gibba]|nr:glycoside hydrolase family 61 protein [Infundibulicybe gibba]
MKAVALFLPLFTAACASAHGFVSKVTIDGKAYTGGIGMSNGATSIIRQVSEQDPIKGATNPSVNCGTNAKPSTLVGDANPGSEIDFDWTTADGGKWPHNTGPMLTYMASCGSTTCDKYDSGQAKWFKTQQVGRKAPGQDWAQIDIMNGAPAKVFIPSNITPGNYLIRHEIIALHLGVSLGGAEFYVSCTQLRIGGNGNGAPSANELVSLPGAYSDNDPGIFDPSVQVYDPNAAYVFPGPNIASFVNGGGPGQSGNAGAGNNNNTSNGGGNPSAGASGTPTKGNGAPSPSTSSGMNPTNTAASNNAGSGQSCQLKRNVVDGSPSRNVVTYKPRHLSRVMRSLLWGKGH